MPGLPILLFFSAIAVFQMMRTGHNRTVLIGRSSHRATLEFLDEMRGGKAVEPTVLTRISHQLKESATACFTRNPKRKRGNRLTSPRLRFGLRVDGEKCGLIRSQGLIILNPGSSAGDLWTRHPLGRSPEEVLKTSREIR